MVTRSEEDALDEADFALCVEYVRAHAVGEAEGVFGPHSLAWVKVREPALLAGGFAAVLLQMAHPAIATGVAEHSNFIEDLAGRARRTSATLYEFIFGTTSQALTAARRLHVIHGRVRGTIDAPDSPLHGRPYRANEQHLLRWVAATVRVAATAAFEIFVRPLTPAESKRDYDDFVLSSALSGVRPDQWPADRAGFDAWFESALDDPDLHVGRHARTVARTLLDTPLSHSPFERIVTSALLPPRWRDAFGLPWTPADQRAFDALRQAAQLARHVARPPFRHVVAWHQAQLRVDRARGGPGSRWARALEALDQRWTVPTALRSAAR